MKKLIMVAILIGVASLSYSQQNIDRYITECISYISKTIPPIPNGFHRGDRTTYLNEDSNIALKVINGRVMGSVIGAAFDLTNEALEWQSQFYDYFENNNWSYSELSEYGVEIYIKNKIYALIISPSKRDDNQIVAMVMFIDDLNNLKLMN
jgi:hypothetical protein